MGDLGRTVAASAAIVCGPTLAWAQGGAPVVTIAPPLARQVVEWDEYTGRFEASERVEVRARVSGYVERVHFGDGRDVKQGDLLFTIDQRPFQIALTSAEADLSRAQVSCRLDQVAGKSIVRRSARGRLLPSCSMGPDRARHIVPDSISYQSHIGQHAAIQRFNNFQRRRLCGVQCHPPRSSEHGPWRGCSVSIVGGLAIQP